MSTSSCVYGALALECSAPLVKLALPLDLAAELADHIAADLMRFLPGVETLDLAVAAAGFDPTELLRPNWPVHTALAELAQQAPGRRGPQVLGIGAHEDAMPRGLNPDPALREGPLRLIPFVLRGDTNEIAAIGRVMEESLIEKGMAQAACAYFARKAFATPMEHARYLSLNDLLAMTATQYDFAGIGSLWPLIEAALLAPEHKEWLDAPPEPLAFWDGQQARIALMDFPVWLTGGYAPEGLAADRLERAYERFQMRQRQYAAVLGAHGIAVQFDHVSEGQDPRDILEN